MTQPTSSQPSETTPPIPTPHWAFLVGAGALALFGLTRRSSGSPQKAPASDLLTFKSATKKLGSKGYSARATFRVAAGPDEAYALWRDFSSLPRFMPHLQSVRVLDKKRSVWTAKGPLDKTLTWTAEITEDSPGKRIAWRSLPKSEITNQGSVEFRKSPEGRGTYITSEVNYTLPGGPVAKALIAAFGNSPDFVVTEDLRRFKSLLEANEVATTVGQPHGPRSLRSKAHEFLLREDSNMVRPQAS